MLPNDPNRNSKIRGKEIESKERLFANRGAVTIEGDMLEAVQDSLDVIDDWDLSDHCNIRHLNGTDDKVTLIDGYGWSPEFTPSGALSNSWWGIWEHRIRY
jgi:hypothetical protein